MILLDIPVQGPEIYLTRKTVAQNIIAGITHSVDSACNRATLLCEFQPHPQGQSSWSKFVMYMS
jgi:hypothetical protein